MNSGYRYIATLQLRTPLAVLLFDGATSSANRGQPENPFELWQGIWAPTLKSWKELGIDMEELPEGQSASDIGPVEREPYRRFLIYVRRIAEEKTVPVQDRIKALKAILAADEFRDYRGRHGGERKIIDALFPKLVFTIPNVNSTVANTLWGQGLKTVARIRQATDAELRALPWIGQKTLLAIRLFCDSFEGNPCADRMDATIALPQVAMPMTALPSLVKEIPRQSEGIGFRIGKSAGSLLKKFFQ